MPYTIDVACSETSGSGWSIDYNKMPGCAGTSCAISDFDTMLKEHMENAFQKGIKHQFGGTWKCTATASPSSSDPLDDKSPDAVLSAVPALPAPFSFMADSIGEGDGTCVTETRQIWQDEDLLNEKKNFLDSCTDYQYNHETNTSTLDYSSCDAAAAANTTCSCEFVFHPAIETAILL